METELTGSAAALAERVAAAWPPTPTGRIGVAYSGGVDSAVLLALAVREYGSHRVVALLGVSDSLAARERTLAHEVAQQIGANVVEVATNEMASADYRANGVDRCYHCKSELFRRISDEVVAREGLVTVAYGENADDAVRPDRPGAVAATEHEVLRPLAVAGLTKADVREVARALGLAVADKPASPCLASRIPHGEEVTPAKLAQIESAELVLAQAGFSDCRVRHHGEIARLEVPAAEIGRFADDEVRRAVVDGIRAAGFRFVACDLVGIQSGAFTMPLLQISHAR